MLVESASLLVRLQNISSSSSPARRVSVSQVVVGGGEISLDSVDTGGLEGGEISLKLDVSHAVSGWLSHPDTNLGLRLSLERLERLERAELVLESRERQGGLVRERRGVELQPDLQPDLVTSRTDCQHGEGQRKKCCR